MGMGEVGKALKEVLETQKDDKVFTFDIESPGNRNYGSINVLHICFPYSKNFVDEVVHYICDYDTALVIIHSTVEVGTTRKIRGKVGGCVVHSPVRGKHPNMVEGLKIFVKYIGTDNEEEGTLAKGRWKV